MTRLTLSRFVLLSIVFTSTAVQAVVAQQVQSPYYLDFNSSEEKTIHPISDFTIGLQYHDGHGRWKEMVIEIFSWKHEKVATLLLDKSFGMNKYTINLKQVSQQWEMGGLYICRFKDEGGKKYTLAFQIVPQPEFPSPVVEILVNPITPRCDGPDMSTVEFIASIKGGMAPYKLTWYILNDRRNGFLYQPREENVKSAGRASSITVTNHPGYYAVVYVEDACGNTVQKAVNLLCEQSRKKINTIFAEEISLPYVPKPNQ